MTTTETVALANRVNARVGELLAGGLGVERLALALRVALEENGCELRGVERNEILAARGRDTFRLVLA